MANFSIERRIIKRSLICTGLIVIIASILVDLVIVNGLRNEFDVSLLAKARLLVTLTKQQQNKIELDFADEFMPEFSATDNPEYFQLWIEQVELLERSRSLQGTDLTISTVNNIGHHFSNSVLRSGQKGRLVQIVFYPQIVDKSLRTPEIIANQKKITLVVAKSIKNLEMLINKVHFTLALGVIAVLGLTALVIWYNIHKVLLPLRQIQKQFADVNSDNLGEQIELKNAPVELFDMVDQFNQLMSRLFDSFGQEKRFTSDVAHELRTPLSELTTMAEVALRWPENIEATTTFPQDVLDSSRQIQATVNSLLDLARCEKGQVKLHPEKINLSERFDNSWSRHKSRIENKSLTLNRDYADNTWTRSSVVEFDLIINNLISNAIEYCPINSDITVSIKPEKKHLVFSLSNKTDSLTKDDLPFIFERMWRKDQARSSSSHSGLGLSLVKAYTKILGLSFNVELSDQGLFTVKLNNFCIQ